MRGDVAGVAREVATGLVKDKQVREAQGNKGDGRGVHKGVQI